MRVEDVAALWQSERNLQSDRAKVEAFQSRWNSSAPFMSLWSLSTSRSAIGFSSQRRPQGCQEITAVTHQYPDLKTDESTKELLEKVLGQETSPGRPLNPYGSALLDGHGNGSLAAQS